MNKRVQSHAWARWTTPGVLVVPLFTIGCQTTYEKTGIVFDEPVHITTPSVENVRAAKVDLPERQRPIEGTSISAKDGAVSHASLFYHDPFEIPPERLAFAWAADDLCYLVYGPLHYFGCTVATPVSAVMTPPWQITESDGQLRHRNEP